MDIKIGRVTHYYDKISVAIIELDGALSNGDTILFKKDDEELFEQVVDSMQIEHEKIESANKGDIIGLKVSGEVKEDADVYKKG